MKTKTNFDMELAELWQEASAKLRDEHLVVNQLEELLRGEGITEKSMMFDVAGGFGFPSIQLAKRGYQITYMDGSPGMLQRAMRNADLAHAPAYMFSFQGLGYTAVPWQEYPEAFNSEAWDAVLCTGNSLPYAVSWGKGNPDLTKSREQVKFALDQFHRILEKDGILYVDKQPEDQESAVEDVGEVSVERTGERLYLSCSFNNDRQNRVRNWTLTTRNLETEKVREYPSRGYLLLEDELVPLLHEVGFQDVEKHILRGDIYEGFIARKRK
jgi:SAM-dependent methyltransferase